MTRPYYLRVRGRPLQLYLFGLKRLYEEESPRTGPLKYTVAGVVCFVLLLKYCRDKFRPEFERLDRPACWVPRFVYAWRYEHYKYWELSRLARGLSGTFSRYEYDPVSEFIFHIDAAGQLSSAKFNLDIEAVDRPEDPLFEEYINAYKADRSAENRRRAAEFLAYNALKCNPLDLKNYLYHKPLVPGDWVRALYSLFMTSLGLTNYFRYDHILSKSDLLYEFERLKLVLNPDHRGPATDRKKLYARMYRDLWPCLQTYFKGSG